MPRARLRLRVGQGAEGGATGGHRCWARGAALYVQYAERRPRAPAWYAGFEEVVRQLNNQVEHAYRGLRSSTRAWEGPSWAGEEGMDRPGRETVPACALRLFIRVIRAIIRDHDVFF